MSDYEVIRRCVLGTFAVLATLWLVYGLLIVPAGMSR